MCYFVCPTSFVTPGSSTSYFLGEWEQCFELSNWGLHFLGKHSSITPVLYALGSHIGFHIYAQDLTFMLKPA
jgi:hypothetical protein